MAEKTGFAGKSVALNSFPPSGNVNSGSWPVNATGTGVPLTDSAVLSGGSNPTGTITFTLVAPGGSTVDTESVTVNGNGTYKTPVGYTIPYHGGLAGIYQWNASYSGDANNDSVSDNNDPAEQVEVTAPVPPTFTADTPPAAIVGIPYSYQFQATGTEPITFSATGLPAWAQLDSSRAFCPERRRHPAPSPSASRASNGTLCPMPPCDLSLTAQYEPPELHRRLRPPVLAMAAPVFLPVPGHRRRPQPHHVLRHGPAELGPVGPFHGRPLRHADRGRDLQFQRDRQQRRRSRTRPCSVSLIVAGGTLLCSTSPREPALPSPTALTPAGPPSTSVPDATVTIDDGTFTGGAIFNVATGAVVSITGSPSFSGTLTGSGGGTRAIGGGRLYIGTGGLTLNFAGSMFQWTGGQMDAATAT